MKGRTGEEKVQLSRGGKGGDGRTAGTMIPATGWLSGAEGGRVGDGGLVTMLRARCI